MVNIFNKSLIKLDSLKISCLTDIEFLEDDDVLIPGFFACLNGIETTELKLIDPEMSDPNEGREIFAGTEGEFYEDIRRF